MATDWLQVIWVLYEPGQKPAAGAALDWLFDRGCHTEEDGGNETCEYRTKEMDSPERDAPTEQARGDLKSSEGYIWLWNGDVEFNFDNWVDEKPGLPDLPHFGFEFPKAQFRPHPTEEAANARARKAIDLVADFADETQAHYAYGAMAAAESEVRAQDAAQILQGHVDEGFWFNYWSHAIVDTLGRETVLAAPADVIDERSDVEVLLCPYLNPELAHRHHETQRFNRHFGF